MSAKVAYYAGMDIGSAFTKAALVSRGEMVAQEILPSGGNYRETARMALDAALSRAGVRFEDLAGMVVTGIGAESAPFSARQVSDISCQSKGCLRRFPSARTVIDIGGQFTRAARLTPGGKIADFLMSEKCAAGSGRFL